MTTPPSAKSDLADLATVRGIRVHDDPVLVDDDPIVVAEREPIAASTAKRALDIVGAILGLIVTLPVTVLALVATRVTTGPPALFRQTRIGCGGETFTIYKIRTMYVGGSDAEHRAHVTRLIEEPDTSPDEEGSYKLRDPRVTRIGRVLRMLSIDELPQLVNVLRGEMSLVGPRPMLDYEHELLSERHKGRVLARPGMTGLWQVSGRSNLSVHEMLELDLDYVEQWSFGRDLLILLRTPFALLSR